jgi:UDP-N-acetylmuramoyl-tripeptide--D-alanyl-D-alanine ligase
MLQNLAEFSGIELLAIFNEQNLHNIDEDFHSVGVVTDTRIIKDGNLFVAVKGENFDGHNFISKAFESNAKACIVAKDEINSLKEKFPDKPFITVDDTVVALGKLAAFHRRRFNFPIIGIGGSNGKTTTKEMIAKVLSSKYNVLKTYGNFNNQIGVPLMLLQLSNEFDIAVLEIGTNSPGEIYYLSNIVKPTHALITNIGKEHLEFLLDLDGVELEEAYLFSAIITDGFGFINYDDERLKNYGHIIGKFMTYGIDENAHLIYEYTFNEYLNPKISIKYNNDNFEVNLKTTGYTSVLNAVAAISVATQFDINKNEIINSIEEFLPLESDNGYGRMALNNFNGIIFFNDTYNANPDSMLAGLKNLELMTVQGNKIAVLGDMRELGETSPEEHFNIIKYAENICNYVLLTGEFFVSESTKFNSSKIFAFETKDNLIEKLESIIKTGDCVLVKGSRGMKMETVINYFKK